MCEIGNKFVYIFTQILALKTQRDLFCTATQNTAKFLSRLFSFLDKKYENILLYVDRKAVYLKLKYTIVYFIYLFISSDIN